MLRAIVKLLVSALAVFVASYILPGAHVKDFWTAIVVALVLGIANAVLRPILVLLTIPVTILTMGLFLFVINALMVLLVTRIVPGFSVDGFWWALLFSVVVSLISWFVDALAMAG